MTTEVSATPLMNAQRMMMLSVADIAHVAKVIATRDVVLNLLFHHHQLLCQKVLQRTMLFHLHQLLCQKELQRTKWLEDLAPFHHQ